MERVTVTAAVGREFSQDVEVAGDECALRDDAHGVAELGEHFQAPAGELAAAARSADTDRSHHSSRATGASTTGATARPAAAPGRAA